MSKQMTSQEYPSQWEKGYSNPLAWYNWYHTHFTKGPPVQDTKVTTNETKPTNAASDTQVGGKHYHKMKIQVWDFVIANDLDYFQGSILKYVCRWKDKDWIKDLYKARHFLDKYIETMEAKHTQLTERPE